MVTRLLRIHGKVQGVGFRDALIHQANRLGLTGWVRNRVDGTVEAVAQGNLPAVDNLIAWARKGPPAARVTRLSDASPPPEYERTYLAFDRWPTV